MKRIILMLLLTSAWVIAFQQAAKCQIVGVAEKESMKQRLKMLRKLLDTQPSIPITVAEHSSLSGTSPVNVFILTGFVRNEQFYPDQQVYDNYLRWLNEWNQKEGKIDGLLKPVTDISQSDVIIVRFANVDLAVKEARMYNAVVIYIPFFGYIINRKSDNLEILFHWANDLRPEPNKDSGDLLRNRLFKLMKARAKD